MKTRISARSAARRFLLVPCLAALLPAAASARDWETLSNCKYMPNPANDGDSFHVLCPELRGDKHKVFRLCYVDTPETDRELAERMEEQRAYWNLPDTKTVLKCGKAAEEFTKKFLAGKKLTVHTQWEDAKGQTAIGRNFALVEVGGEDLGYALVRNGLARVYGMGPDLTGLATYGGASANVWWSRLRKAEHEAKQERKGCWAFVADDSLLPPAVPAAPGGRPGFPAPAPRPPAAVAPAPAPAPVPAPAAPAAAGRDAPAEITLARDTYIYSLKDPSAPPRGVLRAGMAVTILEAAGPERVRVRFKLSNGTVYEGAARRVDLGLR